jgi:hypothetical protein
MWQASAVGKKARQDSLVWGVTFGLPYGWKQAQHETQDKGDCSMGQHWLSSCV